MFQSLASHLSPSSWRSQPPDNRHSESQRAASEMQSASHRDEIFERYEHEKAVWLAELASIMGELPDTERQKAFAIVSHIEELARNFQHYATYRRLDSKHHRRNEELAESYLRRLHSTTNELERVEAVQAQTSDLLQQRTVEWNVAKKFLNRADALSEAEVIKRAGLLNTQIFQVAAYMAEMVDGFPGLQHVEEQSPDMTSLHYKAVRIVGDILVDALRLQPDNREPNDLRQSHLEIAFRMCISYCCRRLLLQWRLTRQHEEVESTLSEVFGRIFEAEEQAVSGKWRSMMCTHLKGDDDAANAFTYITDTLATLLAAVGRSQLEDNVEFLRQNFKGKVDDVVKAVLLLRESILEDTTSTIISPLTFNPGKDYNPSLMDNVYAERNNGDTSDTVNPSELIVGTVGVGLYKKMKIKPHRLLLLKPPVVLLSSLQREPN